MGQDEVYTVCSGGCIIPNSTKEDSEVILTLQNYLFNPKAKGEKWYKVVEIEKVKCMCEYPRLFLAGDYHFYKKYFGEHKQIIIHAEKSNPSPTGYDTIPLQEGEIYPGELINWAFEALYISVKKLRSMY